MNALIFGLGLFFLGLRLVGDNLRRLFGSGFRSFIKRSTHSPLAGAALGVLAGGLMQSATAVTFIMVSMTGGGLIKAAAALPIILWCNVGLTALAFVATLDIHPLIAYLVGGAGIALGTIRIARWQALAGTLLGLGLILCGLQEMSAGAAPLKDAAWFREAMLWATNQPPLTFLAGIAAAAILQSNTGAAMLVITLAANGLFDLKAAMLLIYGANLGAIALRMFLSAGLDNRSLRLVRWEDFFCLFSGLLMVALYAVEAAGVPLIGAFVSSLPVSQTTQLAVVFLLSNFLPALVLAPFISKWFQLLKRLWPDKPASEDPSRPMFLRRQALDDPGTAQDLLGRELARLLGSISVQPRAEDETSAPSEAFRRLSTAIEEFAGKLVARQSMTEADGVRLHLLRTELSVIRHIEEEVRYFCGGLKNDAHSRLLADSLKELLQTAARAAESGQPEDIAKLRDGTKRKNDLMTGLQQKASGLSTSLSATARFEDFAMAVWTLHRLAKVLDRLPR